MFPTSADFRLHRLWRQGPFCVSVALSALIAVELVRLSVAAFGGHHGRPALLPLKDAGAQRTSRVDVRMILSAHLFGVAASDSSRGAENAPVSTANLVLDGVIATRDPRGGLAIIRGDAASKVYAVGADVGGALLHSVFIDHVLLDRGGTLETLSLPRLALQGLSAYAPDPARRPAGRSATLGDVVRIGASVNNPAGKLRGFRIFPRANRGAFSGAGLHGGDLVTAVNGRSVQDMNQDNAQQVFDAVRGAASATFTVENIAGPREVTLDLAQADADAGNGEPNAQVTPPP